MEKENSREEDASHSDGYISATEDWEDVYAVLTVLTLSNFFISWLSHNNSKKSTFKNRRNDLQESEQMLFLQPETT